MASLTITLPDGLANHDIDQFAAELERIHGHPVSRDTMASVDLLVALDVLLAVARMTPLCRNPFETELRASISTVERLRDKIRSQLR